MTANLEIGNRIKQAREFKGYTQEQLGKELGMNKSTIQRYETGQISKIKLPVLEAIANALNVNPNWLALKSEIMESSKPIPLYFDNKVTKPVEKMTPDELKKYFKSIPESFKKLNNLLKDFNDKLLDCYAENTEALIYYISSLNHEGRKEILKRAIELNQIEKYTKQDNQQSQLALKLARKVNGDSELQTAEDNEADYINAPKNDIDM